jgi:hypothetical protein
LLPQAFPLALTNSREVTPRQFKDQIVQITNPFKPKSLFTLLQATCATAAGFLLASSALPPSNI